MSRQEPSGFSYTIHLHATCNLKYPGESTSGEKTISRKQALLERTQDPPERTLPEPDKIGDKRALPDRKAPLAQHFTY